MRRHAALVGAVLSVSTALIAIAAACGGSSSSDVTSPPKEAGGGDGASSSDAGGGPYTLDDVCERTAPLICDIRKPCCEGAGGPGFNQPACITQAKAECNKDVAEVLGGRMTFHGDRIDACIPKYRAIFEQCTLTFDVLQKALRDLAACQAFEGQLAEGASCERTSQCKPGATKDDIVGCDDDTKKCKITKVAVETGACALGDGLAVLCEDGLYCDADFSVVPYPGTCKKKTALGVVCDKDKKPFSLECGLGNYCENATSLCTVGKSGGVACGTDLECASVSCTKPDAGVIGSPPGTCGPLRSVVKVAECKGQ